MLIHGQEFDFSLLNANDLDRLEDALDEMTREGEAETARCERENLRLGDRPLPVWAIPEASARGIWVKCKNPSCRKEIEIKL